MDTLIEIAPVLVVALVAVGVIGYLIALALAVYMPARQVANSNSVIARIRRWFEVAPAQNLGLPCAAVSAFAIVAVLLHAFPAGPNVNGVLAFKAFGLEFSGPSGPITLWLMCFLGFVVALKLLR